MISPLFTKIDTSEIPISFHLTPPKIIEHRLSTLIAIMEKYDSPYQIRTLERLHDFAALYMLRAIRYFQYTCFISLIYRVSQVSNQQQQPISHIFTLPSRGRRIPVTVCPEFRTSIPSDV